MIETQLETPVLAPGHTFASITDKVSSIVLGNPVTRRWWVGFGIAFLFSCLLLYSITRLLFVGVGIWGINIPVAWGCDIINFVWWIGIGHAGTLISAILLLLRQSWRTSINRFAEAMTLFAVSCAALYPLLHMGRPWYFYWMLPYPNTMELWPQWRSPLIWDVFAVSTYAIVSLLFWYIGLIPDLATLRDRTKSRGAAIVYGILAMGWRQVRDLDVVAMRRNPIGHGGREHRVLHAPDQLHRHPHAIVAPPGPAIERCRRIGSRNDERCRSVPAEHRLPHPGPRPGCAIARDLIGADLPRRDRHAQKPLDQRVDPRLVEDSVGV